MSITPPPDLTDLTDLAPPAVLDTISTPAGAITVVREDLLPGGTKQRAVLPYLRELIAAGATSFVYASPAPGFAQVALAYVSARLGVPCTLFCDRIGEEFHEFSLIAHSYGAAIHPSLSLKDAEEDAFTYARTTENCVKLPLGFGDARYLHHYGAALAREWEHITASLGHPPRRIWLPVGSATLATAFRKVLPPEITLHCVNVRVLDDDDERLRGLANLPGVVVHRAREAFLEPCAHPVPVPSNVHYDAKLWPVISEHGHHQDLWWNVAR
ncbi:hypothetical protein ACTG9Q_22845 [Actinokineospora sp. 24-640]